MANIASQRIAPAFVGRDAELAQCMRALRESQAGTGRCVLLVGEAGIGKSRLLAELRRRAGDEWQHITGRCIETDSTFPYAPLVDALRNFLAPLSPGEQAEAIGAVGPEIVKLLPELSLTLDVHPTPALDPEAETRRRFEAIAHFFLRQDQPLLLIIEDVHWSDETSVAFLRTLVRRIRSVPIALLMTYRPTDATPMLADLLTYLHRERLAEELTLAPLPPEDIETMLQDMLGRTPPALTKTLYDLSEGNPFYVEEVVGALIDAGDIFHDDGRWQYVPASEMSIPRSILLTVQRRVRQLSEESQRLLTIGAVIGRHVDVSLLARVTDVEEGTLLTSLKDLIEAGFLIEATADTVEFRHALTREAIYAALLARERRMIHRDIAEILLESEKRPGYQQLITLAHHTYQAGMWSHALDYCHRAGDRALAQHAPHAALEQYARAAEAADALSIAPPLSLIRARADARATVGEFDPARVDYETTLSRARQTDDRHTEWQTLLDLGFHWMARDYQRAGDYFRQALDLARRLDVPQALARSLNRIGNWNANAGQLNDAFAQHDEALALFEELADERGIAETLDLLATTYGIAGNHAQSAEFYRRAIPLFERLGDKRGLTSSLTMLAADGDIEAGQRALRIAREIGWRDGEANAHLRLGMAHSFAGNIASGLAHLERGRGIADEIDHHIWSVVAQQGLGLTYLLILAYERGAEYCRRTLDDAGASGAQIWAQVARFGYVTALVESRQVEQAADVLADAPVLPLEDPQRFQDGSMRFLAIAYATVASAHHRHEYVCQICETVLEAIPDIRTWRDRTLPHLLKIYGASLAAQRRHDDAIVTLRDAVAVSEAIDMGAFVWRCRVTLAGAYTAAGQRSDADIERLAAETEIAAIAETIPDQELRAQFRTRAGEHLPDIRPLTPRQRTKQRYDGLTRREREVAALVARGHTNREIADELHVTVRTIKTHVSNILAKLDFTSRTQIATWALGKGLIDGDSTS